MGIQFVFLYDYCGQSILLFAKIRSSQCKVNMLRLIDDMLDLNSCRTFISSTSELGLNLPGMFT